MSFPHIFLRFKMAEEERSILCFQHCDTRKRIFSFEFPSSCPLCQCNLHSPESQLVMPPFRVPFPFSDGSKSPCCVVIKPTSGNFLYTYHNSCNLHIGVTCSRGIVYEYKKEGIINSETHTWTQCLVVNVIPEIDDEWKNVWDINLTSLSAQSKWSPFQYDENNHNCYLFVLTFLRLLHLPSLADSLKNKTLFCQKFILPQTVSAAKYITLFRRILNEDIVIQNG